MSERATFKQPDMATLLDIALTVPGELGSTYCRFRRYSVRNQALLYAQGLEEPVANYKRWQELGRQVVKGSSAAYILRPITIKDYEHLDEHGEPKTFRKFKLIKSVFGVSQTEGEDLPEYEPPEWNRDRALGNLAVTLTPFRELDGNMQGYSIGREIAISPVAAYPLKTLMHELGHVVIGHTADGTEDDGREDIHRGVAEFQAEGTAYLSMNALDALDQFDASASRAYIQRWLKGEKPSDKHISQVFTATDQILRAGRETVGEAADA